MKFIISYRARRIDDNSFGQVCSLAGKLFAGIRYFFAKCIRNKLNAFFLDPMYVKSPFIF